MLFCFTWAPLPSHPRFLSFFYLSTSPKSSTFSVIVLPEHLSQVIHVFCHSFTWAPLPSHPRFLSLFYLSTSPKSSTFSVIVLPEHLSQVIHIFCHCFTSAPLPSHPRFLSLFYLSTSPKSSTFSVIVLPEHLSQVIHIFCQVGQQSCLHHLVPHLPDKTINSKPLLTLSLPKACCRTSQTERSPST